MAIPPSAAVVAATPTSAEGPIAIAFVPATCALLPMAIELLEKAVTPLLTYDELPIEIEPVFVSTSADVPIEIELPPSGPEL